MIKISPFSRACACARAYARVCAATSENETPLRHNIGTFYTRDNNTGIQITSRLDSSECSGDFACACVCVEFRFHMGHPYCLRLCLRANENHALPEKECIHLHSFRYACAMFVSPHLRDLDLKLCTG